MPRPVRRLVPALLLAALGLLAAHFGAARFLQDPVLPGSSSHTIFAAFDTLGPDWRTTLLLNNSTCVPITANLTVYSLDGVGALLPTVRLEAHEHKRIAFDPLIAPLGDAYARGSLQLDFVGAPMGVGAILSTMNQQSSLVVEALLHSQMDFISTQVQAVWWAPDREARMTVSLTNVTAQAADSAVTLTAQDGSLLRTQPVPLGPHQTRMLNLRELIARDDLLGGISVHYDGAMPGSVLAQGCVLQPASGFSYDLPFVDPATLGGKKFSGAGIPLGLIGGGSQPAYNLSGKLLLRNLSVTPMAVSPSLQRGSAKTALPQVALNPGESKQVNVPPASAPLGDAPIGIDIPFTGNPGDLLAQWFSADDSGNTWSSKSLCGASAPRNASMEVIHSSWQTTILRPPASRTLETPSPTSSLIWTTSAAIT
jgi:hypothetical protein